MPLTPICIFESVAFVGPLLYLLVFFLLVAHFGSVGAGLRGPATAPREFVRWRLGVSGFGHGPHFGIQYRPVQLGLSENPVTGRRYLVPGRRDQSVG